MEIAEDDRGGYLAIAPRGTLDSNTAKALEDRLMGAIVDEGRSVLVDLARLEFMSSAGLRVFLLAAKRVSGTDLRVVLCAPREPVAKVFAMSGFDRILDIQPDAEAGAARMAG